MKVLGHRWRLRLPNRNTHDSRGCIMNSFNSKVVGMCGLILMVICGVFFFAGPLLADETAPVEKPQEAPAEDKPAVSLYVDILSQYIFRGVALSRDGAVFQPSGTVTYKGFSVSIWGNFDTADYLNNDGSSKWNETDFTFSYTHELFVKELTGTVGGIYYSMIPRDTFEIYAGVAYAFPWLTLGVTGYRDVQSYSGWWMQIDLTRNFALPWCGMSADVGASFGFTAADNANDDFSGWTAGTLSAGLNIPLGNVFTITPKIGYSFPLASDAEDRLQALSWDERANHVFGGIRVTAAF